MIDIVLKFVLPLFEWLPDQSFGGVSLAVLATFVSVVAGCFIAGLIAQTTLIRGLRDRAEQLALFVPGYAFRLNILGEPT